jgi:hypothetical protein
MRAHVGHAGGLRRCARGCDGRRARDLVRSASRNEAATDLARGIELAARECPRASDRIAWPRVVR